MPEIYKTRDYSIFKHIANRKIVQSHVDRLVECFSSDEDYVYKCPLRVSKSLILVDGQHRLRAAQKLSMPVYYRIDLSLDTPEKVKQAIIDANANQLSWKLGDYIYSKSIDNHEYLFLQKMIDKYKKFFSGSSILFICKIEGRDGKKIGGSSENQYKIVKKGKLKISNKDQVTEFLDVLYGDLEKLEIPLEKKKTICNRFYMKQLMYLYYNPVPKASYKLFITRMQNFYNFLAQPTNETMAYEALLKMCHKKKS